MSLNGNPLGHWHPGPPLSNGDKAKLWIGAAIILAIVFGPLFLGFRVFG